MKKHQLFGILLWTISIAISMIANFIGCVLLSFSSCKQTICSVVNSGFTFDEYITEIRKYTDPNRDPKDYLVAIFKKIKPLNLIKGIFMLFTKAIVIFLSLKLILFNPSALIWLRLGVLTIMVVGLLQGARYLYLKPYTEKMTRAKMLSTAEWFIEWANGFSDCNIRVLNVTKHEKGALIPTNATSMGININHENIIDSIIGKVEERDKSNSLFSIIDTGKIDSTKTIIAMALIFLDKSVDLRDYQTKFDVFGGFSHRNFRSNIDPDIIRLARFMKYDVSIKNVAKEKMARDESRQTIEKISDFIRNDSEMPKNNKTLLFEFHSKKSTAFSRHFARTVNLDTGRSIIGNEPKEVDQFINCSDLTKLQEIANNSGIHEKGFYISSLVITSLIKSKKPIFISSMTGHKDMFGSWSNLHHVAIFKWLLKALLSGYKIQRNV
ncbi:MAG: hypothetical protein PHH83_01905 [Patescibacteria group bacterium]|nr:hypothetical protein [Patescibacteria group bacterium]